MACSDCSFLFSNPQPSDEVLGKIYGADYFCGSEDTELGRQVELLKCRTADLYMEKLAEYGVSGGSLLEIGCGDGYQLLQAHIRGFKVTGIEYSTHAVARAMTRVPSARILIGDLDSVDLGQDQFDVCIMADVIEHVRDPRSVLKGVWNRLKPGGCLLIATPSLDSWSARLMGKNWMEFKPEHLSFFSRRSLESLLWQTGFRSTRFDSGKKVVSFAYVKSHFTKYPVGFWTSWVRASATLLPRFLLNRPLEVSGSGMLALATKGECRTVPVVSVIVPVYNERETVGAMLALLLKKQLNDAEIEIIVVESNSSDGSREIVRSFEGSPHLTIVYEDVATGKGAATRLGLSKAKGDLVLIQDADLEYDLEDYDFLLEPILMGREAFVLGARHGGAFWKMRQFKGAYGVSLIMNLAHWFFTALINISFGLELKDPFTMYKVFRRDAISGIVFKCSRFDFDWELLIQLVRKGYTPLEIPVNYRSRSYNEGKKVRFFRDPLTWMATLVRLRMAKPPAKPVRGVDREIV